MHIYAGSTNMVVISAEEAVLSEFATRRKILYIKKITIKKKGHSSSCPNTDKSAKKLYPNFISSFRYDQMHVTCFLLPEGMLEKGNMMKENWITSLAR